MEISNEFKEEKEIYLRENYETPKNLYLYLPLKDKQGNQKIQGMWIDNAIWEREGYLDQLDLKTIVGQMLVLEMDMPELDDDTKKEVEEEVEEEVKRYPTQFYYESTIDFLPYFIRKNYLSLKTDFEQCYEHQKRLIHIDFLRYMQEQCYKKMQQLKASMTFYKSQEDELEIDWNYYSTSLYGDVISEREHYIAKEKGQLTGEIEGLEKMLNEIKKELEDGR